MTLAPQYLLLFTMSAFFGGFFLAWYALKDVRKAKVERKELPVGLVSDGTSRITYGQESFLHMPETIRVSTLGDEDLDRYLDAISKEQEAVSSAYAYKKDEPTLRIGKQR